ncbi:Neutral zinc metallopeptidase, Zn-binding site [Phytophthora palmivora]|uniref:Neutral zinc metallopeptidase, Zn-binding site n=1 Tax=Phytophthora palmivora TaxID=4796 RepID=A0A2P4YKS0_9STRA|nr:Neutral zinc metallopeptidase, Zn-binding site [Phytophthora palmivora]
MHSVSNFSFSARRLVTSIAIAALGVSSIVSAAPTANATSQANTFGTVTSGSNKCVVGNPNSYISANDVDWVWNNRIGPTVKQSDSNWNVMDNENWIMDHIVRNKGTLNYCVRWDSTKKLSKSVASKFEAMLNRQYKAWNDWLVGYNCWPYNSIKVKVVGFAVRDAKLLDWSDDSLGKIYTGDLDGEGVPMCAQSCYRYNANGAWSDTSGCQAQPFDISLWLHQGLQGGFGYDWGQEVNLENMLETLDNEELTIVAHEIGHGFGLPDFYEEADMPSTNFPSCIMRAGSSMSVTPADGWMLRRVLEHTKSRYNF